VTGSVAYGDGSWQGFKKNDFEVTIDLKDTLELHEIRTSFLQDQRSWIFFPRSVEYSLSVDGQSFTVAASVANDASDSTTAAIRKSVSAPMPKTAARFVRVKASSIGQCPPWHPGRGGEAWLFIDEITVN